VATIGSNRRPASQEDIDAMKDYIEEAINTGKTELVVHHSIKFKKLKKLKPGYTRVLMVGNEDYPACSYELEDAEKFLESLSKNPEQALIVTHRYSSLQIYGCSILTPRS
jgi:hypothetical protein